MTDSPNLWLEDGRLNIAAVDPRRFTVTADAATGRTLITPNIKIPSHPGPAVHDPRVPFTRAELWRDDGELWLRSIVVDPAGRVVSCGFPKFFELVEVPEMEAEIVAALKASEAWLSPKLDGTCAIASMLEDGTIYWRTRGSLDFGAGYRPEYAAGLNEARERPLRYLDGQIAMGKDGFYTADDIVMRNGHGFSFLFELTGPCNGMAVCDRGGEHALTILAAVKHPRARGSESNTPKLDHTYPLLPNRLAMRGPNSISIGVQPGTELDLIRKAGPEMGEGFVIILPDGRMVKVKTEWYMRNHHIMDRMTPRIVSRIVAQAPDDADAALVAEGYDRTIHTQAFDIAAEYKDAERRAGQRLAILLGGLTVDASDAAITSKSARVSRAVHAAVERVTVGEEATVLMAAMFAALDDKPLDPFVVAMAMACKVRQVPSGSRMSTAVAGQIAPSVEMARKNVAAVPG